MKKTVALQCIAVAALCSWVIGSAQAATIAVNSLFDNGVGCTLRKAVANANAGGAANAECTAGTAGGNTVVLGSGTHVVNLPVINLLNRAITIQGAGPGNTIIDGQNVTRLFDNFDEGGGPASTAITITIQGLTITRGRADSVTGDIDSGAGMYIEDNATVNFNDVAFVSNFAVAYGAALDSRGTVNINNGTFNTNVGSNAGEGGAIRNTGTLTITNSAFFGNTSGTGGAIYHSSSLPSRSLTVRNSTFFGNTGFQRGGAIAANNPGSAGPITLTHVTIAGNGSPSGSGGGIFKNQGAAFNLDRSIIAGNTAATGPDCNTSSSFNSLNYNVFGTLASCTVGGATVNNFVGAPLLNMAGNNGGPTPTISLQPYSPARDRAPTCATGTDQRGQTRPLGTACDSGAFEAFPTAPQPPTIGTATAGNGQATVNFTAPGNNGGSAITLYVTTANPGGQTATNNVSPILFTGLTNGVAYTFTVRAINNQGSSFDSAASNSVTPAGPPGPPTGVVATAGNGSASVTFTPPVSNGGSPITSYTAISSPGGFSASGSGTTLVVAGLSNGTGYFFTVRANNANGSSVPSPFSNTVVPFVPQAPFITSAPPPGGVINAIYQHTVSAGGAPMPTFSVISGVLPPGLSLDSVSGAITGTPNSGGTFTGVISATNGVSPAATQMFSIAVMLLDQSIVFGMAPEIVVGGTGVVAATGGASGNPVVFSSTTPAVCTVSGTNGSTVTGLSAGSCTIAANQAGNSNYNPAPPVTQTFAIDPPPIAFTGEVYSRKVHGAAGAMDLAILDVPLAGAITVEPRAIGSGHQILFRFDSTVTSVASVAVTDAASAAIGATAASFIGNDLIVTLTAIPDNTRVAVSVTGVNGLLDVSRAMGFLIGDINNSRSVNATDISGVKARSGQTADATNFRFDVNASGGINATDISAVKARSGLVLP
jgi:Dockerin type I domain/Putative Ig domain/Fibronectin type III domain